MADARPTGWHDGASGIQLYPGTNKGIHERGPFGRRGVWRRWWSSRGKRRPHVGSATPMGAAVVVEAVGVVASLL